MVIPILEYCSVVWNPIYVKDINLIESVQRRYTRRAQLKCGFKKENYHMRLKRWKIPTLEMRRLKSDIIVTYKILYGFMDLDRDAFFRVNLTDTEINIYPIPIKSCLMNNTQTNTLADRVYKIWNTLPLVLKNTNTVESFKRRMKVYDLTDKFESKLRN
jgi:hypothetical protein